MSDSNDNRDAVEAFRLAEVGEYAKAAFNKRYSRGASSASIQNGAMWVMWRVPLQSSPGPMDPWPSEPGLRVNACEQWPK